MQYPISRRSDIIKQIFTGSNFEFLVKSSKSRSDFAKKTGISINTIKAVLDKHVKPSLNTLIKLNEIFNISLDDLVYTDLSKENNN